MDSQKMPPSLQTLTRIASAALLGRFLWTEAVDCYEWAVLAYIWNLPIATKAANSPVTMALICLCVLGSSPKNIPLALRCFTISSFWAMGVHLLHRAECPTALLSCNKFISHIQSSEIYWLIYWGILYWLYSWKISSTFIVQMCVNFRRIDRAINFIQNTFLSTFGLYGFAWVRRNKMPLFDLIFKCLVNLVEYYSYYIFKDYLGTGFWEFNQSRMIDSNLSRVAVVGIFAINAYRQRWCSSKTPWPTNYDANAVEAFTYNALRGTRSIRLLLVHPQHPLAPIQCSLLEYPLEATPPYEALSYVWGDATRSHTVYVNNRGFLVTANAYQLLKERRSLWLPKIFWVDCICIDQENLPEKTNQVQLMKEIYRKAFVVTVSLNSFSGETSVLDQFSSSIEAYLALAVAEDLGWVESDMPGGKASIYAKYAAQTRSQPWHEFQKLLANPWFDRIWVIQEVALSTSVRVVYGKQETSWRKIFSAFTVLARQPHLISIFTTTEDVNLRQTPPSGLTNLYLMGVFRDKISHGTPLSFSEVVFACRNFKATDPRDKVFGILGLCSATSGASLRPNYLDPLGKVYIDAARLMLSEEGVSRILSIGGVGYTSEPDGSLEGIPSWVPNWAHEQTSFPMAHTTNQIDYRAGTVPHPYFYLSHEKILALRGRMIDKIEELGTVSSLPLDNAARFHVQYLKTKEAEELDRDFLMATRSQRTRDPYIHTNPVQPFREAFWRTLIGDRTLSGIPAPATYGRHFEDSREISYLSVVSDSEPSTPEFNEKMISASTFTLEKSKCAFGRSFCITSTGYIGYAPPYACVGDFVYVVLGAQTPLVLRPVDNGFQDSQDSSCRKFRLVGECFIHGIMMGEAIVPDDQMELLEIV